MKKKKRLRQRKPKTAGRREEKQRKKSSKLNLFLSGKVRPKRPDFFYCPCLSKGLPYPAPGLTSETDINPKAKGFDDHRNNTPSPKGAYFPLLAFCSH